MSVIKKTAICVLLTGVSFFSTAQSIAEKYQYYISKTSISEHLHIIASDSMEGRATGTVGQDMAADYIARQFKLHGLLPISEDSSYFQPFNVVRLNPSQQLIIGKDTLNYGKDIFANFQPAVFSLLNKEVVLAVTDKKGKEEPSFKNKTVIFFDTVQPFFDVENVKISYKEALSQGAASVIYVTSHFDALIQSQGDRVYKTRHALASDFSEEGGAPLVFANKNSFSTIINEYNLSGKRKKKEEQVTLFADLHFNRDTIHKKGINVAGWMPSIDTTVKETLVLMAHYDHLGVKDGEIYNGADDNGTGTVALMEIAKAFSVAKKDGEAPMKNILFLAVSAEEIGLLGSRYYTENPLFPLTDVVTVLNVDMIGRIDEVHEDPNYVYVIGSDFISETLHEQNERANRFVGIHLDYTYNDINHPDRLYFRSDHYNFAQHGIPSIFYFGGMHEDYHQPTDTVDKILFDKVEKITRLIYFTAWEVVNN